MGNRHVKIFRSTEKQMKLRVKIPEKQKEADLVEKISHVKVDGRKKHVQNATALVSLPVEKVTEKKVQKGNSSGKRNVINRVFSELLLSFHRIA